MVMLVALLATGCDFFVLNGDGTNTAPSENTQDDDETDVDDGTGVDPSENTVAGFKETGRLLYNEIKASMVAEEREAASFMFNSSEYINLLDYEVVPNDESMEVQKKNNASFIQALEEVMATGKTLYIPDGKYYMFNEDSAIVNLNGNIAIRGQSRGKTVLIDPPRLDMSGDVYLEHISVMSPRHEYYNNGEEYTVAFLYLRPAGMHKLFINNVFFSGNHDNSLVKTSESYRTGQGYSPAIVTNCEITNAGRGIVLYCDIRDGLFEKNIMQEFGERGRTKNIDGIVLGSYKTEERDNDGNIIKPAEKLALAHDTIIQKNYFKNFYNKESSVSVSGNYMHGILIYGENSTVQYNYLENLLGGNSHYGIYTKDDNGEILNNTIYNAGNARPITNKGQSSAAQNNVIRGNRIIEDAGVILSSYYRTGIHAENPAFLIEDNYIRMTGNNGEGATAQNGISSQVVLDEDGVTKRYVVDAVVINNEVITTGEHCVIIKDVIGNVRIEDNALMYKPCYTPLLSNGSFVVDAAIAVKSKSDSPNPVNIKINNNIISTTGVSENLAFPEIRSINIQGTPKDLSVQIDSNSITFDNSGRQKQGETIYFASGILEDAVVKIKNNNFKLSNAIAHNLGNRQNVEDVGNTLVTH
jgi:hypothetical protein